MKLSGKIPSLTFKDPCPSFRLYTFSRMTGVVSSDRGRQKSPYKRDLYVYGSLDCHPRLLIPLRTDSSVKKRRRIVLEGFLLSGLCFRQKTLNRRGEKSFTNPSTKSLKVTITGGGPFSTIRSLYVRCRAPTKSPTRDPSSYKRSGSFERVSVPFSYKPLRSSNMLKSLRKILTLCFTTCILTKQSQLGTSRLRRGHSLLFSGF